MSHANQSAHATPIPHGHDPGLVQETMMIRNLTPHVVTLHRADGTTIDLQPESTPARVAQTIRPTGHIDPDTGIEIAVTEYGEITDLPTVQPGVWLVVSTLVVQQARKRRGISDLLVAADAVRDEAGRIVGCRALAAPTSSILVDGAIYPRGPATRSGN